jgi:1,4-dihydroxy-2-naphthoate octaprenyltransferase
VAPVLLGWAVAYATAGFSPGPAIGALVAAILVQVGTNLANDWLDFEKGADTPDRLGPARAAQMGWLGVRELRAGTVVVLGLAGLIGAWLAVVGGWPVVAIAVTSLICAIAYTGGPLPLAYVGLGDVFVLVFFGPVAVLGTVYVQTLQWPVAGLIAGLACGLLSTAILVVNNLRDRHTDAKVGKRTLAVRFGARAVRVEYTLAVLAAFGLLALGWATDGRLGWALPLLSVPLAVVRVRDVWTTDGAALNPQLGQTGQLVLAFALLLSVGLVSGA